MIKVVYLGQLADMAGTAESEFAATSGEIDWADLLALLENHVAPRLAEAVQADTVKLAVNGRLLADRAMLDARDGDEIALLPPVSGG